MDEIKPTDNWDIFIDKSHHDLWCVRDVRNSQRAFHFIAQEDAENFIDAVRKAHE